MHLAVETKMLVYSLGGRGNLLFIGVYDPMVCMILGIYYRSTPERSPKKGQYCISLHKCIVSAHRLLMKLLWLVACTAGASLYGAPERGSSPDGNKGTCRSGARFPIDTTWN